MDKKDKFSKIVFDDGQSVSIKIGVIAEYANGFCILQDGQQIAVSRIIRIEPQEAKK